jgi:hypothetical protein
VFINVHTNTRYNLPLNLTMWTGHQYAYIYHSRVFEFDDLDAYTDRNVHTFVINDLIPNTTYSFQIDLAGSLSQIYYYRTLPASIGPDDQLVIVNGGDIGNSE